MRATPKMDFESLRLPMEAGEVARWEKALSPVLGSVARWRILVALVGGNEWLPVSLLAARAKVSPAACSKHMLALRRSGLVEQGLGRLYRLLPILRPAHGAEFLDLGICLLRLRPPSFPATVPISTPHSGTATGPTP